MNLKKKILTLLSFLMMSVFLLTGCSPEQEQLATELITEILESETGTEHEENTDYDYEDETDAGEITVTEEELPATTETEAPEETLVETPTATPEETLAETPTATPEETPEKTPAATPEEKGPAISEDGTYTSKDEVAAYIHAYGHLPSNFITKKQAKKLGWVSSEGNLWEVAPGKSIGGDYFGNYEGKLPEKKGRDYYECDIDTDGTYRGAKRIVFSDDGLIYYTKNHYKTFELLYGEE
jgi:hypothetical protein